jgi:hypothetical protein
VVAVADRDDHETIETLARLQQELPLLDVRVPPPADDPSWSQVWASWLGHAKRWREPLSGPVLAPRQRRQVVYGYHHVEADGGAEVGGVLA